MNVECVKYMLLAQDMNRTSGFYREVIDFSLKFQSLHWSELSFGEAIMALEGNGAGERNLPGLSYQVSDLEMACKQVVAYGGNQTS